MAPAGNAKSVVVEAAAPLVPQGRLWRIERLTQPDAYWSGAKTLPVLRLRFTDSARSWLYIDPATGELIDQQDRARRLYRWAFDLLHTWNWLWLIECQPLRDVIIWLMSIVGLMLSASGVWLGYRRLSRYGAS